LETMHIAFRTFCTRSSCPVRDGALKITGTQIAQNLWHCPGCGASPLDIFDTAFWPDDEGESFPPVEASGAVRRDHSDFEIVDGRPKLDLTEEKILLLIRSALLDDAANVSERLGALEAGISVDDDDGLGSLLRSICGHWTSDRCRLWQSLSYSVST
jgi:hypothetical protein